MAKMGDIGHDEAELGRQLAVRLVGEAGHGDALANLDFFVDTMSPSLLEVWMDLAETGPGGLPAGVYSVMYPADKGNARAAAAFWLGVGNARPSADFLRAFIETVGVQLR
jgi:hypothetical protein